MQKKEPYNRRWACLKALQQVAEELGHSPTKAEYQENRSIPSVRTIADEFGSWNSAKEVLGLETYCEQTERGFDFVPESKCEEMRFAYRGSYTDVAEVFDVAVSTARFHIRGDCTHIDAEGHATHD